MTTTCSACGQPCADEDQYSDCCNEPVVISMPVTE